MSQICGNFKFQSEDNYADFLEAMGASKEMVDRVMASMPNVSFKKNIFKHEFISMLLDVTLTVLVLNYPF